MVGEVMMVTIVVKIIIIMWLGGQMWFNDVSVETTVLVMTIVVVVVKWLC